MESRFNIIDLVIRLFLVGVLLTWCFVLLRPFIGLILWAAILAIAIFPIFLWLKVLLGGRGKLAGTLLIVIGVLIILGPVSVMATLFVGNAQDFAESLQAGTFAVPPPPEGLPTLPFVGEPINKIWELASVNLKEVLRKFQPQLESLAKSLLLFAADMSLTLLKFLVSIIIAGILTINAESINAKLQRFFMRLTPSQGENFLKLATATIRGVARGIIGVSVLQSLLIGIGFMVAGIPAAGLLALLCLVLAIIQIGPGLVVLASIIFAWSSMGTLMALLFTIWMVPMTLIDNILKPILMARGLPIPTIVILIGVLGGTLTQGILGLFIGPVILSLGYELIKVWINNDSALSDI